MEQSVLKEKWRRPEADQRTVGRKAAEGRAGRDRAKLRAERLYEGMNHVSCKKQ